MGALTLIARRTAVCLDAGASGRLDLFTTSSWLIGFMLIGHLARLTNRLGSMSGANLILFVGHQSLAPSLAVIACMTCLAMLEVLRRHSCVLPAPGGPVAGPWFSCTPLRNAIPGADL